METLLRLLSLLVPREYRPRWREEWLAEMQHGGRRMITGALPDAWTLRRLLKGSGRASRPRAPIFHALDQDVRYALRGFSSGKGFTVAVVGSLAIGIAATTTAFALVNATLLQPFPGVHNQKELVRIRVGMGRAYVATSWDEYQLLRNSLTSLHDLSAAHQTRFALAAGGATEPRTHDGLVVTGNYFELLGVKPAQGRFFAADEDAEPWAHPAVVISHRYWERTLASDPGVLQRTLIVNGAEMPIIGVAPEGFDGPFTSADLWTTFATSDLVFRNKAGRPVHARSAKPFFAEFVGRLKPASTIDQTRAQAAVLSHSVASVRSRRLEGGLKDVTVRAEPLRVTEPAKDSLRALSFMAVPLIVLAIACVNAANLLLARATRCSADWLVRLALGASRWRLVRQLLVESLLLALGGGILGVVLCSWTIGIAQRELQVVVFSQSIDVDANVLLFTLLAAVTTSLVFGLGPALSVTRAAVSRAPEAGRFMHGPFGSRTRAVLVMLQAALCLGLLATGAQFANTLRTTLANDGLPDAAHFLSASVDVDKLRYSRTKADTFFGQLLGRVRELPMVSAASLVNADVLSGGVGPEVLVRVWVPGEAEPRRDVLGMYAAGDFFGAMGLPLLRGRNFSSAELNGPPRVVVVNEPFAEKLRGDDALGRTIRIAPGDGTSATAVDAMIVGIVAPPTAMRTDSLPMVFYPAPITAQPASNLLVRFDGSGAEVTAAIRGAVMSLDSRVPIERILTGEELRRRRNTWEYTLIKAVSILGMLSLVLAAAGLYGVASYMVTLRQREIGIRMAMGAERASVLRLIVRQSILPVIAGCVLGAAGAAVVGMLLRSRLYGVSPVDPLAFAGAALLLLSTMIVACLVPARHAARVDPIQVLRTE
jgi:predicted permease